MTPGLVGRPGAPTGHLARRLRPRIPHWASPSLNPTRRKDESQLFRRKDFPLKLANLSPPCNNRAMATTTKTNKYAGKCACGRRVGPGAGSLTKSAGRWTVTCSYCGNGDDDGENYGYRNGMCEDAPCCGCCGPSGDGGSMDWLSEQESRREDWYESHYS